MQASPSPSPVPTSEPSNSVSPRDESTSARDPTLGAIITSESRDTSQLKNPDPSPVDDDPTTKPQAPDPDPLLVDQPSVVQEQITAINTEIGLSVSVDNPETTEAVGLFAPETFEQDNRTEGTTQVVSPQQEPLAEGQKPTSGTEADQTCDVPGNQKTDPTPGLTPAPSNTTGVVSTVSTSPVDYSEALSNMAEKAEIGTAPLNSIYDNHLSVTGQPEQEQPVSGEQEIARSREMSLSMDSNPDTSMEPALEKQSASPQFAIEQVSLAAPGTEVSLDLANTARDLVSGPVSDSPKTATLLKFPLPAKPAADQTAPLFTSSPPPSVTQAPRQPVLSRIASLRQRVEKDPMDGEAWIELIADAEKKGDLEKTREVYHSFLQNFPDAAKQWIAYADLELGHGHFPEVEQIFSRCLRSSVSVELWAFYLNYIRRVNPVEGDKAAASRAIIISAYDFSLNHIGIDHESGKIWMDYINIVKSGEATGTWQEQQKMDSLRKLYQRAVCVPLDNIEQLWKEYDQFEHQMSKMTAKKFLAEKSAQYLAARSALKEMKTLTDLLLRPKVPAKPNWRRVDDHKQVKQWKAYLQWEESNPLELQDKNMLNSRIQYAYRQALMHMRFHPEIWYQAASHLQKIEKLEESLAIIQAGLVANPTSIVLTYALVEAQENLKNFPACYAAFNSLIEYYHSEIEEINKTIEKEIEHGIPIIESKTPQATAAEVGQELTEEEKHRAKEEEKLRSNITALYKPKIDELREAAASVWITEMRFARRTEGIKPARAVFTRARKSPCLTQHVFEASAMMEYYWNKEASVATKVFDLGLKTFSEDVDYVLKYLNFLITLNDDSNARALFEKTVSKLPPAAARPLWQRWAAYEFIYGDRTATQKLESRMVEHFPEWGVVDRLSERHNYNGLQDVLGRELGTAVEPIPLRRSPSPVPAHLEGFGFKRASNIDSAHPSTIPSGPAHHRVRQRERSFSPDFRGKRARAPRNSPPPDHRNGGPPEHVPPPNKRGRDAHENTKRNRFNSPPRGRVSPPPANPIRENPYGWFPDKLRYFLGILPTAASFDGPRLDANMILQVLADSNIPAGSNLTNSNLGNNQNNNKLLNNNRDGFHNNNNSNNNNNNNSNSHIPSGWGPNRGGGGNNLHHHQGGTGRSNSSNNRRGRRK
ncbi:hypothetical protein BY996DRAFT_8534553 [Phakopsora pachyrhizi]|nr:hypothetical protein BY996DRAFT_8534553 [Phakopsora pachyrhizi]